MTTPASISAAETRSSSAERWPQELASESAGQPRDLLTHLKRYASENPAEAALWCFGVGFVLGWRLKPW